MAIKFNVEDKAAVTKAETFRINPNDAKEGRNSRMIAAPNYLDTVQQRAISIAKHGQLQPVRVRRSEDKTLTMVAGYTRRDAILALREGFTAIDPDTGEEAKFHLPDATLWVQVVDTDAGQAFLDSIAENLERKDTTDLQEALAQQELRTTMGWTDSKIARFYGYSNQNRVMALAKLLTLPKSVQTQVHEGKLALYPALDTIGLTDEERGTLFDGSTGENGKIQGATLKKLLRELYEAKAAKGTAEGALPAGEVEPEDEEEEPETKAKAIKRSAKDFERFFNETKDDESAVGDGAAELMNVMVLWFKGRRTDEYLRTAFNEYCK